MITRDETIVYKQRLSKPRVRGRQDKRMLELAIIGLYGHGGEVKR